MPTHLMRKYCPDNKTRKLYYKKKKKKEIMLKSVALIYI